MSPTLTTFLFEAANFLVLVAILAWLFFRPVREALDQRRAAQQQIADQADDKFAAAERMRTEIAQQLAGLETELERRREQATTAASQEAAQILKDARDSARRELDVAKRRFADLDRVQQERLAHVIAEVTGDTVDRLLGQLDQPALTRALTIAACQEIDALNGASLAPVRIESARPLEDQDREALLRAFGPTGESAEFHVNDEIGCGLRISTNCGLIDVSSAGLASFARHRLATDLVSDTTLSGDQPHA